MKIICISGRARHGKDTVAKLMNANMVLAGKKVIIVHYADLLKFICTSYFGWDGSKDEKGRELLQRIGTDVIRSKDPDFWVRFVGDMLSFFGSNYDYVIIPDARFPNEIEHLRSRGYDVTHLRVYRPGFKSDLTEEQMNHPSETALSNVEADDLIVNSGSFEDLDRAVIKWIKEN